MQIRCPRCQKVIGKKPRQGGKVVEKLCRRCIRAMNLENKLQRLEHQPFIPN